MITLSLSLSSFPFQEAFSSVDLVKKVYCLLQRDFVAGFLDEDVPRVWAVLIALDLGGGLCHQLPRAIGVNHVVAIGMEGHKGQSDFLQVLHDLRRDSQVLRCDSHARHPFR